jgi:hypothetical protein
MIAMVVWLAARWALVSGRIAPSIQRRPWISTGGQTPGRAPLATRASRSGTPLSRWKVSNLPDRASTAVTQTGWAGQVVVIKRAWMAARRS